MEISAPIDANLVSVKITVSGAYQEWHMQPNGTSDAISLPARTELIQPTTPEGTSTQAVFYWNETPETKTIKVEASYEGGGGGSIEFNVEVTRPTVNYFKRDYHGTQFQSGPSQGVTTMALSQQDLTASDGRHQGNYFYASVELPNGRAGHFAFIQLIKGKIDFSTPSAQNLPFLDTQDDYMLDSKKLDTVPPTYLLTVNDYGVYLDGQSDGLVGSNLSYDTPHFGIKAPSIVGLPNDHTIAFDVNLEFQTYLVFRPATAANQGGVNIAIAELKWNFAGKAVYNNVAQTEAAYADPANWTITDREPQAGGTDEGISINKYIKWDNFVAF